MNYRLTDATGLPIGDEQGGWRLPNVAVYSTPNSAASIPPATLESLSDAGQAHAIDFIAKDAEKADATWLKLSKALTGPEDGVERKDPYRADRVLIATVAEGLDAMPGDRLLWTRVFVQPINFTFAGYTVASTETRSIKVAAIEHSTNSQLSLGYGLDTILPAINKDAKAPSVESSNKASADINEQYESLGVDIRPQFLRIMRESATGGDVVGNTRIELSMLTDPHSILKREVSDRAPAAVDDDNMLALVVDKAHLTDRAQYLDGDKATITVHPQDLLPHCPLIAEVWMIYEIRQVQTGRNHYLEGLQKVDLIRNGEIKQKVEIVPADDIAPAVWLIQRQGKNYHPGQPVDLRANLPKGQSRKVVSTDYLTVSELAHWLKANGPGKSLNGMTFDYVEGDALVPFKNVQNDC